MSTIDIPAVDRLALIGGRLCLDFVNTANWQNGAALDERLNTMRDLHVWAQRLGLIDRKARSGLTAGARAAPNRAARELREALALRQSLRCILGAIADGARPGPRDALEDLNRVLGQRAGCRLRGSRGGFALDPGASLASWLTRPVAYSALELLTSARLDRLRLCPGQRCGWMFLDESPNGLRRWCSMATCGNRHKAQRHYAATRAPTAN